MTAPVDALALLRAPFLPHQISKLPKPTKAQTDAVKADFKAGIRCDICGTWHHPKVVHLDYVGHAALTDRLLDADPRWTWDPVPDAASLGLPIAQNGMWIRLTVDGVSRYGFGCADGKTGGDAVKEIIGDALRNAAMRFGAALDLWHKGDLHVDDAEPAAPRHDPTPTPPAQPDGRALITDEQRHQLMTLAEQAGVDAKSFCERAGVTSLPQLPADMYGQAKDWLERQLARRSQRQPAPAASDILEDEVPY